MNIEVISIGDEILKGHVVDTNKTYLSRECWLEGLEVLHQTSVRDDEEHIIEALRTAQNRATAVICTGGMGPTVDDFTIEVAAKTFGLPLELNQEALDFMKAFFARRKRPFSPNNEKQAYVPKGSEVYLNAVGTAPGVKCVWKGVPFYFVPGVPLEMRYLFENFILKDLKQQRKDPLFYTSRTFRLYGCAESELDKRLQDCLTGKLECGEVRLAYQIEFPDVLIRISSFGKDMVEANAKLEELVPKIYERVGEFIYGEGMEKNLPWVLAEKCVEKKITFAFAESCTGGLLSHKVTQVPGVSQVYWGGICTYSEFLKTKLLGVSPELLAKHSAVSEECAQAMVLGLQKMTEADLCVSVTGYAGPDGGTEKDPVGTAYVGISFAGKTAIKRFFSPFPRERFKEYLSAFVLREMLRLIAK